MDKILRAFLGVLCLTSVPALAEEFKYTPAGCDFQAVFPHEPGFVQRCPSDATLPCYQVAQFTDRTDFDKTVNIEMSCTSITKDIYDSYDEANMRDILIGMTMDDNMAEAPPISFEEKKETGLKMVSTGGLKKSGFSDKIFISQLWVLPESLMTVEGEMSLESDVYSDKVFADILHSIGPINQPSEEPPNESVSK